MLAHSFLIKSSSKLLVTRTGIIARMSLISGLWFPWPIYMFFWNEIWYWHIGLRWAIVALCAACILFVPQGEDLSFFSFVRGTIFSFQVYMFSKEGIRKTEEFTFRANPCTVCIVHSFIVSFCNEWAFIMDPNITTVTLNCFVTL